MRPSYVYIKMDIYFLVYTYKYYGFFFRYFCLPFPQHRPEERDFLNAADNSSTALQKKEYAKNLKNDWNTAKQLEDAIVSILNVLWAGLSSYVACCFDAQNDMRHVALNTPLTVGKKEALHPLDFSTKTSFFFNSFRLFFLQKTKGLRFEYGKKTQVSALEVEVGEYLISKFGPKNVFTAYNQNNLLKVPQGISIPDIIVNNEEQQCVEAIWVQECGVHGCPQCTNPERKFFEKSMPQAFQASAQKIAKFQEIFPHVFTKEVWECEWKNLRASTLEITSFFTARLLRPVQRLILRDAVRPSFMGTYKHFYDSELSTKNFYAMDMNSAFAHSALTNQLPCGDYTLLTNHEIATSHSCHFDEQKKQYMLDGEILEGIALVRLTCPPDLEIPFISHPMFDKEKNMDKWFYFNCFQCCKNQTEAECLHADDERSFHATLCLPEINFAKIIGYEIEILELASFAETTDSVMRFTRVLASNKLKNSGWPAGVTSNEEKQQYCEHINDQMGFFANLSLSVKNVCYDPVKKEHFKGVLNSFFGRLQMRLDYGKTDSFLRRKDFLRHLEKKDYIAVKAVGKRLFAERETMHEDIPETSTNSMMVQGAYIVSLCRIAIYKHIQALQKKNASVFSADTDSIFFAADFDPASVLPVGQAFGAFKHVHENVIRFVTIGNRRYALEFQTQNGIEQKLVFTGLRATAALRSYITPIKLALAMAKGETTLQCSSTDNNGEESIVSAAISKGRIVKENSTFLSSHSYGYKNTNKEENDVEDIFSLIEEVYF